MPNFHKSIRKLYIKITQLDKMEVEKYVLNILKSYELKTRYGELQIEAFENSILNPTTKLKTNKEEEIYEQVLKNKSKKYRTLVRYQYKIEQLREQGVSYQNIAKYINSHRASNLQIKYCKIYIYRYCKKNHPIKNSLNE